jgi:hypothetical protein
LTFDWSPAPGTNATLTGATTAVPTFIPGIKGTYTFNLVVNDGADNSVPDTVIITVPTLGDIDLDDDVDNNDLRDINGDMKLDALDTHKLVLKCTRQRCAAQ